MAALILLPSYGISQTATINPSKPVDLTTGKVSRPPVSAKEFLVVSANPLASEAGQQMLEKGGSAVDAMIVVQLVLGLVEPQSSGIGGGAFLVHWDNENKSLTTFDGRETAPLAATPDHFLDDNGDPVSFGFAVIGGRSVGTPGVVALLEAAHQRYGKLTWEELFQPAIELADKGFAVSARLNDNITASAESLFLFPATRTYFLSEEGVPLFEGTVVTNPAYRDTLREIAKNGAKAFYQGDIAGDIVATIANAPANPGLLTLEDFENYQIFEREPVCVEYRTYEICGMGLPSSGGLTIGQILKLVEPYDLPAMGPNDLHSWRIIGDATRLAFADRNVYMADADFVKIPGGLLDDNYLSGRSNLLGSSEALAEEKIQPGEPPWDDAQNYGVDQSLEIPSTSHVSIVDSDGNIVSLTTSIESRFGSRLMARGFLLNNQLTDFSFVPDVDGVPVANRVEPGKRPRSSMSPTIVFKDGSPIFVIGSPGGSRIIAFVAKTLIAHLDWGMGVQEAIELPNLVNRYGTFELELDTAAEDLQHAFEALGYPVRSNRLESGLQGIEILQDGLVGGADPRRESLALGR
ncbi:MAG: gamma-glutamyltransferase [Rhizobiaceae bacterium]